MASYEQDKKDKDFGAMGGGTTPSQSESSQAGSTPAQSQASNGAASVGTGNSSTNNNSGNGSTSNSGANNYGTTGSNSQNGTSGSGGGGGNGHNYNHPYSGTAQKGTSGPGGGGGNSHNYNHPYSNMAQHATSGSGNSNGGNYAHPYSNVSMGPTHSYPGDGGSSYGIPEAGGISISRESAIPGLVGALSTGALDDTADVLGLTDDTSPTYSPGVAIRVPGALIAGGAAAAAGASDGEFDVGDGINTVVQTGSALIRNSSIGAVVSVVGEVADATLSGEPVTDASMQSSVLSAAASVAIAAAGAPALVAAGGAIVVGVLVQPDPALAGEGLWNVLESPPIILDLDGNGISVTEFSQSTHFVDGGDGLEHRTAWAGVGDGVLFYDYDGEGAISEKKEYVFTEWDPTAGSDLDALRSCFYSNGDGKLTSADDHWDDFKVEVVLADGTTEVKTLDELGITVIDQTASRDLFTRKSKKFGHRSQRTFAMDPK